MKTKLALLLTLIIASQTSGQTAAPDRFKQLDENGDGKLSRTEVTAAALGAITPGRCAKILAVGILSAANKHF